MEVDRRHELASFLRAKRARVSVEQTPLARGGGGRGGSSETDTPAAEIPAGGAGGLAPQTRAPAGGQPASAGSVGRCQER